MAKTKKTPPTPRKGPRRPKRRATSGQPVRSSGSGWMGRRPFGMVGYGPSGIGKTSLAAHFPGVVFIHDPQETGIQDLVEYGQAPSPVEMVEVETWMSLLDRLEDVAMGRVDGAETLVVDSLTGMEKLCFHHHCEKFFDGDWSSKGFYSFQQGPKNAAKTDWPDFLDRLEDVRTAGVNVFLIGHSTVKPYNNPEGTDWDRWIPKLERDIWDATHRWAQAVLFLNQVVEVSDKGTRKKVREGSERRNIYTEAQGAFDAKNRFGLPPVIDMGDTGQEAFNSLEEAFQGLSR